MFAWLLPWLKAFVFTQLIEVPVYLAALRKHVESTGPDLHEAPALIREPGILRRLGLAALPSTLTHPVVWFVFPRLMHGAEYWTTVMAAECFAIGVEALVLRRLGVHHALAWSCVANGLSLGLGLLLRAWTGWV